MNSNVKVSPIGESWNTYREKHFTAEELAKNDLISDLVGEVILARKAQNLSQRELESISGVKQSVIARMESGKSDPQLSTIIKLLASMGKTLTIAPLNAKEGN